MTQEIYHVSVLPYSHGVYEVTAEFTNNYMFVMQVRDMELIDEWKDGNKEPLINHIKNTRHGYQ